MSLNKSLMPLNLFGELVIITFSVLLFKNIPFQADIIIFLNLAWFLGTILTKNYYINRQPGVLINVLNLSKHFILYFLFVFVFLELFHENKIPHKSVIVFSAVLYIFLLVWRFIVFLMLKRIIKKGKNKTPVIIIGVSVASIHFKEFLNEHDEYGFDILGFFSEKDNEKVKVLGKFDDVIPFCQTNKVSEIICSVDKLSKETLNMILDFAENNLISIKIIPDSLGLLGRNFVTTFIEHVPLLALRKNPFDEVSNQFLKRGFDILFSLFVIVFIMSWFLPLIGILIKLNSKGPIFFIQERTGLGSKPFRCLKFRTMFVNNDANKMQASKNDSRVTKIGALLRKTSLDEMPQFFNVLEGSMSIVGPRPHMTKHTEEYAQLVDRYMIRHLVKPGVTGLSQVMGYRGETQHDLYLMKMRVRMDRFYIDNWSFYLDLKVVWATILLLFRKDTNAY